MGECHLKKQNYEQAEQDFQKCLEYLPVWPGTDDSAYALLFELIGEAQIGEQNWRAAEESLQQENSLLDSQIQGIQSETPDLRRKDGGVIQGFKARSLAYLAIAYLREGRVTESLKTADTAYAQATLPEVPGNFQADVLKIGRAIAQASGDAGAVEKWSRLRGQ
jgi:tetratricopeptide (TPR) repeat protein